MTTDSTVAVVVEDARWRAAAPDIEALCRRAARAALAGAGASIDAGAEVSLLLGDDTRSAALNGRYRGRDGPTNVLSFATDGAIAAPGAPRLLGDVMLAYETVAREAAAGAPTLADHTAHLVVHGVLHLVGFDHGDPREAARMEGLERRVLAGLGVADPYAENLAG
jgi:probable rRNA maturation factor